MYNSAYRQDIQSTMSNLTLDHARKLINGIRATFLSGPPPPQVDPNLLFDVNFDSSLDVDYTIDGNPLAFEGVSVSTPDDGFVSITGPNYLKLTTALPEYMKNTGDQSWVANWRSESTGGNRFVIQTSEPNQSLELSVNQRTGFNFTLNSTNLLITLYKGYNSTLVTLVGSIGQFDMSVNISSIVVTYKREGHILKLYFNGALLAESSAPAGNEENVIDWSTVNNIFANRFYVYSPSAPTHYDKISVYDKILTLEEVEDIYDESQL